jgi:hypothetical protein
VYRATSCCASSSAHRRHHGQKAARALPPSRMGAANKLRNYAVAQRERWNSVMKAFMAGGNYAESGVAFPTGSPEAV